MPLQYLWSRYLELAQPVALLSPANDRHVTFTFAQRTETHHYRPEQTASPGSTFVPLAGGDPVELPPVQTGSKIVEQSTLIDTNGSVLQQSDTGDVAEGDLPRVVQYSSHAFGGPLALMCDESWRCQPTYVTTSEGAPGSLVPARRTRLSYDASTGDLVLVEGYLESAHSLYRFHETSQPVSAGPPTMAVAGWKWLGHYDYTPEGFVVLATGPGAPGTPSRACTRFVPDDAYGQFPKTIRNFKADCDSALPLETNLAFDRGFGVAVTTTAPDLGVTLVHLDRFGRPENAFEPSPDLPSPAQVQSTHVEYRDVGPVPYVDAQRFTAAGAAAPIRSVQLMNAMLEPVLRFDQGDGTDWIVNGRTERDNAGRAYLTHRPFQAPAGTNPVTVATSAIGVSGVLAGSFYFNHDGFGRQDRISENGLQVLQRSFEPLAMELRDAEQIAPAGTHLAAHTRIELTTRGEVRRTRKTIATETITTETARDATGNPTAIYRTSSIEGLYQRFLSWDSLGRMRENYEPNTVHRRAAHPEYTQANPATGANFEVLNTYDQYEAGQVEADATFADDPLLATGRLVATRERGAHTRINYDNRGRARRLSRQVAKPLSQQVIGPDIYAPHWYETRSDFDIADRLTSRSSGADEGPFADGPGTGESYLYSSRGLLASTWSWQHGTIIDNIAYQHDGQVGNVHYGDIAATEAAFTYDARRRLQTYSVSRAASALWTTPSPGYTLPSYDTTQTTLANFSYQYDLVGNPKEIHDLAPAVQYDQPAWPQRLRSMEYDDLYRVTSVAYGYDTPNGMAVAESPFLAEEATGDRTPAPRRLVGERIRSETFAYDYMGNILTNTDDQNATYDRSMGSATVRKRRGRVWQRPQPAQRRERSAGPVRPDRQHGRAQGDASGILPGRGGQQQVRAVVRVRLGRSRAARARAALGLRSVTPRSGRRAPGGRAGVGPDLRVFGRRARRQERD